MKLDLNKLKLTRRGIFFFAYILLIFRSMMSNVTILTPFFPLIKNLSFLILIISFIMQCNHFTKKQLFKILAITISLLIVYYFSDDNTLLILFLLIISLDDIEFNSFLKYDLAIKIVFFCIVILCYKLNLTTNYFMYRIDGTIRSSMGFSHPNVFGMYLFNICADYFCIKYNKLKARDCLLLLIVYLIISISSDSRSSQYGLLIILGLTFLSKASKDKFFEKKWVITILKMLPIIFISIMMYSMIEYSDGNTLFQKINIQLSNRLYYWNYFFNNYGINIFGNKITYINTYQASLLSSVKASVLDNSFLYILINYGLCGFSIFYMMIIKTLDFAKKNKKIPIIIMMTTYLIIGIFENIVFRYQYNAFIFYFYMYIHENRKKQSVETS